MGSKAPRSLVQTVSNSISSSRNSIWASTRTPSSWICQQCRSKSTNREILVTSTKYSSQKYNLSISQTSKQDHGRYFSASRNRPNVESQSKETNSHELPSKQEFRRSKTSRQLSHMMDNIQTNIFVAGQRLNDLTGYSAIEALKNEIQAQEALVQSTRERFQAAKEKYTRAISQRSQSQREVNELLQRKHAWSPQDLERFTELYRSDHANEQAEAEAQQEVTQAELLAEEAATKLSANILARYHEEQIWSDKIRRMSTWGTWGLMGVNVFLFLIFQIGVEPWRRKRLVKGFEDKVVEALEKETAAQRSIAAAATPVVINEGSPSDDSRAGSLSNPVPTTDTLVLDSASKENNTLPISTSSSTYLIDTAPKDRIAQKTWTDYFRFYESQIIQLFSEERMEIRKVDATTKFIEGALSSAIAISLLSAILRSNS